jgi:hypothetical protein
MILPLYEPREEAAFLIQPRLGLNAYLHEAVAFDLQALGLQLPVGELLIVRTPRITHAVVTTSQPPETLIERFKPGLAVLLPEHFSLLGFQAERSQLFVHHAQTIRLTLPVTGLWIPPEHPSRRRWLSEAVRSGLL